MEGSIIRKVARLVGHHAMQPQYIGQYISQLRETPLSLRLPWFSYAAIDFLEGFTTTEHEVFEFGSGGSTLFFSERSSYVTSVEENAVWRERVERHATAQGCANVRLIPSDWRVIDSAQDFFDSNYLAALSQPYDIIVVDGSCEWIRFAARIQCFRKAQQFLKPNGIIVLDDSWRYDEQLSEDPFESRIVFKSVGPCRPGVTTTTIYFFS